MIKKLWDSATPYLNDGKCLVGRVKYYSQSRIVGDLVESSPFRIGEISDLLITSFFVKRNSFSHEEEYRMIYVCNNDSKDYGKEVKEMTIDPYEFIMNIQFDPRSDSIYYNRCKRILTEAFKYPSKQVSKSSLYDFEPNRIKIIR